jgi:hypothetical protein
MSFDAVAREVAMQLKMAGSPATESRQHFRNCAKLRSRRQGDMGPESP